MSPPRIGLIHARVRALVVASLLLLGLTTVRICRADTPTVSSPRTVRWSGPITLREALAQLERQTGTTVVDRRRLHPELQLTLDLRDVTFWTALDAIATAADARVSLYEADWALALVDGPAVKVPTWYDGVFRLRVLSLTSSRDLESAAHTLLVNLEIAWEPALQPFFLDLGQADLDIVDDQGRRLKPPSAGQGQSAVTGRNAMTFELRLPGFDRSVRTLRSLHGRLSAIGPRSQVRFTFPSLDPKGRFPSRDVVQAGVTASLHESRLDDDLWSLTVRVTYPPGGPKFESFQTSWMGNNQVFLERGSDRRRLLPTGGRQVVQQNELTATVRYHFIEDSRSFRFGAPSDWTLHVLAPGGIAEVPIRFEFTGLPLP